MTLSVDLSRFFLVGPWLFFLSYLSGATLFAGVLQQPWQEVVLFPPEPFGSHGSLALLGQGMALFGTFGLIGLVPGLPVVLALAPSRWGRLTVLSAAGLLNLGLMVAMTTGLKLAGYVPLTRFSFLVGWGVCLLLSTALVFLRRSALRWALLRFWPTRDHWRWIFWSVFLAALVGAISYPKLVIENFNGDGVEIFAPAEALRSSLLPYWDLEAKPHFGLPIAVPLWATHYGVLPWILLLGPSEGAVRLPLLATLPLLFISLVVLVQGREGRPVSAWLKAVLGMGVLFSSFLLIYYGGYDPYVTDAVVAGTYLSIALLVVLQVYCLQEQHGGLWVCLALLGVATRYWVGFLSLSLLAAAWWRMPSHRREIGRLALGFFIGIAILTLVAVRVGFLHGILELWMVKLHEHYAIGWRWPFGDFKRLAGFLGEWMVLSGVLPFLSLGAVRRLSPAGQVVACATLAYGVFLAGLPPSRTFHPKILLGLLTVLTGAYWLRQQAPRRQILWGALSAASLAGLTVLIFPVRLAPVTGNRELGRKTCMLFGSAEEAMRHSRIAQPLYEKGLLGGSIDYSAWAHYATVTEHPDRLYPYYLIARPSPPVPGAVLVWATLEDVYFFAADPEAAKVLRDWRPPPRRRLSWLGDLG